MSMYGYQAGGTDGYNLPAIGAFLGAPKVQPYLGQDNLTPVQVSQTDNTPISMHLLADAYRFVSPVLESVVMTIIKEQDQIPISRLLPLTEYNGSLEIRYNVQEYDDHVLTNIPETGVGRVVSDSVHTDKSQLFRQGIGCIFGWEFAQELKGKRSAAMQMLQMVNAAIFSLCIGAVFALFNTAYYNLRPEDRHVINFNGKEATANWIDQYMTNMFCLNKEVGAPVRLFDDKSKIYRQLNKTQPDTLYVSQDQLSIWMNPAGGMSQYTMDRYGKPPERFNTGEGLIIWGATPYPQGPKLPLLDVTSSTVVLTHHMTMSKQMVEMSENYNTKQRDIMAYSWHTDDWVRISIFEVHRKCGVFVTPTSTAAMVPDGSGGTKVGSLSNEIGVGMFAGYSSLGEYMADHEIFEPHVEFLTKCKPDVLSGLMAKFSGQKGTKQVETFLPDARPYLDQMSSTYADPWVTPTSRPVTPPPPPPSTAPPPVPTAAASGGGGGARPRATSEATIRAIITLAQQLCGDRTVQWGVPIYKAIVLALTRRAVTSSLDVTVLAMIYNTAKAGQNRKQDPLENMIQMALDLDNTDYTTGSFNPAEASTLKFNGTAFGWVKIDATKTEEYVLRGNIVNAPGNTELMLLPSKIAIAQCTPPIGTNDGKHPTPYSDMAILDAMNALIRVDAPLWVKGFAFGMRDYFLGQPPNRVYTTTPAEVLFNIRAYVLERLQSEPDWTIFIADPVRINEVQLIVDTANDPNIAQGFFVGGAAHLQYADGGGADISSQDGSFNSTVEGLELRSFLADDMRAVYQARVNPSTAKARSVRAAAESEGGVLRGKWILTAAELKTIFCAIEDACGYMQDERKIPFEVWSPCAAMSMATLENDVPAHDDGTGVGRPIHNYMLSEYILNQIRTNGKVKATPAIAKVLLEQYEYIRKIRMNASKFISYAKPDSKYVSSVWDAYKSRRPSGVGTDLSDVTQNGKMSREHAIAFLNGLPIRAEYFDWAMQNNAPPMLNYILVRHPRFRATSGVMMKRDGYSGLTLTRRANMFVHMNPIQHLVAINMIVWSRSIVAIPKSVLHLGPIHTDEYRGGGHTTILDIGDDQQVQRYKNNDPDADIIPMATHADEDVTNDPHLPLTGRMHSMLAPDITYGKDTKLSYATARFYSTRMGWSNDESRHPFDQDPFTVGIRPKQYTISVRTQFKTHGGYRTGVSNNESLDRVIIGKDAWGVYTWAHARLQCLKLGAAALVATYNAKVAASIFT